MLLCRTADTDGLVTPGAPPPAQPAQYKFFFNIGSVDSFERKMEEAQAGPVAAGTIELHHLQLNKLVIHVLGYVGLSK